MSAASFAGLQCGAQELYFITCNYVKNHCLWQSREVLYYTSNSQKVSNTVVSDQLEPDFAIITPGEKEEHVGHCTQTSSHGTPALLQNSVFIRCKERVKKKKKYD